MVVDTSAVERSLNGLVQLMVCVVYVFLLTLGLGGASALLDYALPRQVSRRWLWFAAIVLSVVVPPLSWLSRTTGPIRILGRTIGVVAHPTRSAGDGAVVRYGDWLMSSDPFHFIIEPTWLIATVLLFAVAAVHAFVVWRATRDGRIAGVTDGARIIRTKDIGPAATFIGGAGILLPRWVFTLPKQDRRLIIRHELEHIRHSDDKLLFVSTALVALFPWIVPLWWQLRRLASAIETDCDRRVVAALGGSIEYGELLLRLSQASRGRSIVRPALLSRRGALERRLVSLLDRSPRPLFARALAAIAAVTVALAVLTMSHPVGHAHDGGHARDHLSTMAGMIERDRYSVRSASSGSTRTARRAGR